MNGQLNMNDVSQIFIVPTPNEQYPVRTVFFLNGAYPKVDRLWVVNYTLWKKPIMFSDPEAALDYAKEHSAQVYIPTYENRLMLVADFMSVNIIS